MTRPAETSSYFERGDRKYPQHDIVFKSAPLSAASFSAGNVEFHAEVCSEQAFKPQKMIVAEEIQAVYRKVGPDDRSPRIGLELRFAAWTGALDILLLRMDIGKMTVYPVYPALAVDPCSSTGFSLGSARLPCAGFRPASLGGGVSWPVISGGTPWHGHFGIQRSVLSRIAQPEDYELEHVVVTVTISLFGRGLQ